MQNREDGMTARRNIINGSEQNTLLKRGLTHSPNMNAIDWAKCEVK